MLFLLCGQVCCHAICADCLPCVVLLGLAWLAWRSRVSASVPLPEKCLLDVLHLTGQRGREREREKKKELGIAMLLFLVPLSQATDLRPSSTLTRPLPCGNVSPFFWGQDPHHGRSSCLAVLWISWQANHPRKEPFQMFGHVSN